MATLDQRRVAGAGPDAAGDAAPNAEFAGDVIAGLEARPKTLPCKYLYDDRGSALFDAICAVPEYYPTRTEIGILRAHAEEIAAAAGPGAEVLELGSGASVKSRILLSALDRPSRYLPVDIAADFMRDAASALGRRFPDLAIEPVAADFTRSFTAPPRRGGKRLLFFPGSTVGNFTPAEAEHLLGRFRRELDADLFVVGVDLRKDAGVLIPAYDDAAGVTAAFDLNLLARINRELGADFDLDAFRHEARWNAELGRIEMHLVSLHDQSVTVCGRAIAFVAGESIHTESSHKFTVPQFSALAAHAGWDSDAVWTDAERLFSVHLLRA